MAASEKAAQALKVELEILDVMDAGQLPHAFEEAKAKNAEALNVFSSLF